MQSVTRKAARPVHTGPTLRLAIAMQLAAGAGAALAQTAPSPTQTAAPALPAVVVSGQQEAIDQAPPPAPGGLTGSGARMGILGNVPVLDTPFSVTGYTARAIQDDQARSVADVVAHDPSVRLATARSNIGEDLTIRGFAVPSSDFALNGLFGLAPYWRVPLEAVEQVEIVKGPSAALYGMAPGGSVGGVVNLVPKRATAEPITRLTVGASSDSVLGSHLDLGRRFGTDDAFGVRLNVMHREGDTAVQGQSTRQSLAALGLDFRHRRLRASLDLLWNQERLDNVVRQFSLSPQLRAVPAAPSGRIAYPGLGWTDGHGGTALFKAEYDISDAVTAYAAYGRRRLDWGALAANPVLLDAQGNYSYAGGWQRMPVDSRSAEAGLRGRFQTGAVSHSVALGYTQLAQDQELGFYTGYPGGRSNLYAGQLFPTPSTAGIANPTRPYLDTRLSSLALADTLGFMGDRLLLTLGARQQRVEGQNYNFVTGQASGARYDETATTPFVGAVFKLRPDVSLYASYVEGLSRGDTAPVSAALSNPGAVMPPYTSKQKEMGAKFELGRTLATVALFELTKPSAGVSGNTFGVFGEQRNRGLEATLAGEVAPGLRLLGGATAMDGVLAKAATAALQGKKAIGVPKWQLNLGAEWDVPALPGVTLSGRYLYTARTAVDAANTLYIPGWPRVDAGVRYATRLAERNVTFRLNVENLANRRYWGTATAGYLFVGAPRTVSLSATVDL